MSRLQPDRPASKRGWRLAFPAFGRRSSATLLIEDWQMATLHCDGVAHRLVNETGDAAAQAGHAPSATGWPSLIPQALERLAPAAEFLRIAVGPHLAPVVTLRSPPGRLSDRDWLAYASHRLTSVLGDRASGHAFRVQGDGEQVRLGSAMPERLIAACTARPATSRRRIRISLMPSIALAVNLAAARRWRARPCWVIAAMAQTLHAALIQPGRVQVIVPFDRASAAGDLQKHLAREALLLGETPTDQGTWVELGTSPHAATGRPASFSVLQPLAGATSSVEPPGARLFS